MSASTPLLSVTVLNYNYAQYLPVCLDSILGQTFRDFELIIINDCSKDNSLEVLQPYLADPRVRLVDHQINKGFVVSLIEGTDLSRGKYVTVISADDYCISPLAFARLIEMMESEDAPAFAYSAYGQYGDDGVCRYVRRTHPASYIRSGLDEFRELVSGPLHSAFWRDYPPQRLSGGRWVRPQGALRDRREDVAPPLRAGTCRLLCG